ncbi:MAG: T9SS type A sorting domain-containing protein [Bacteroidota bacterium]
MNKLRCLLGAVCFLFGGLASAYAQPVVPDSGMVPTTPNTPHAFSFAFTDVAFDAVKPHMYVTSEANKQFYQINLATGLIEKFFDFELLPGPITITPDGSMLYVALHTEDGNPLPGDSSDVKGYIAAFDLNEVIKTHQYGINENPYDLLATDDGHIYATTGSSSPSYLRSYSASDGVEVSRSESPRRSSIKLHPSQSIIYGADQTTAIQHWSLESGVITDHWRSPFHSGFEPMFEKFYISPLGDHLITKNGDIYTTSLNQEDDLVLVDEISPFMVMLDAVFDTARSAFFWLEKSVIEYANIENYQILDEIRMTSGVESLGVHGDSLYVVRDTFTGMTEVFRYLNPMLGAENSTSPTAAFSVSPESGLTTTTFTFDASTSIDAETPAAELLVRWDWNSDGLIDTDYTTEKVATNFFSLEGAYDITLEVRDAYGFTTTATRTLNITFGEDAGAAEVTEHKPFQYPLEFTDIVFDPVRPYGYISAGSEKKIYFTHLGTGLIEKEFVFEFFPDALFQTLDGTKLYALLLTHRRSASLTNGETRTGIIAEFDLDRQVKTNQYAIDMDPFDLVVSSEGYLYVSASDDQSNESTRRFDVTNGTFIDEIDIGEDKYLDLHPDENRIYATDRYTPFDGEILQLGLTNGEITSRWGMLYDQNIELGGRSFISPKGDKLVTSRGLVLTSSPNEPEDLQFINKLASRGFSHAAFDTLSSVLFMASGPSVYAYDLEQYSEIDVLPAAAVVEYVGLHGDSVYVAMQDTRALAVIQRYLHPLIEPVDTDIETSTIDIPDQHNLYANYPNPFNQSTTLKFGLRNPSQVVIKIYNVMGREVDTLVDTHMGAGHHAYKWTPDNLSAGVYFARMTAGNEFTKIVRLMYVK